MAQQHNAYFFLYFLTLSLGSSSNGLVGISTLTSSGCYRLLYHAGIKKEPHSSLGCTCDDATSLESVNMSVGRLHWERLFLGAATEVVKVTSPLVTWQNRRAASPPSRPARCRKTAIHFNLWPTWKWLTLICISTLDSHDGSGVGGRTLINCGVYPLMRALTFLWFWGFFDQQQRGSSARGHQ